MRSQVLTLVVSLGVLAVATVTELQPYLATIHRWGYTLAAALGGLFLIFQAVQFFRAWPSAPGFAALACLGGIVIAASYVGAELFVGPPQRVSAAPGQVYHPPRSATLSLTFPPVDAGRFAPNAEIARVTLNSGDAASLLAPDEIRRVHSYVFRSVAWPAAYVIARSAKGRSQTVTQPTGVAFVSPVLQFPGIDVDGLPLDEFAVPALHREVAVKYYAVLRSRGIDIPLLQLQIKEENGGPLFTGVAVSGRSLAKAGVALTFAVGRYPGGGMGGVPGSLLYFSGAAFVVIGALGSVFSLLRKAE